MTTRPAAVLAFANDSSDDRRYLRGLLREGKAIGKALAPLARAGLHVPPQIHNATVRDVLDAFREHSGQVRIFHFAGHASSASLLFEDDAGLPAEAHASSLAGYLGHQAGLVLVFLNGCCTGPQVQALRAAGVKAVVATTQDIDDTVAAELAEAFYAELAVRPLREAFEAAEHAVWMQRLNGPGAVRRDARPGRAHGAHGAHGSPWILSCDRAYDGWTPRTELEQLARRRRRRWLARGALAPLILLSGVLALSADARRTVCRASAIRSACAAIPIGGVPTAGEQASWDRALAGRSGDGLRVYLQRYPTGAYADEARARLAGCTHRRIETLGPEKDVRYPLPVNANRTSLSASEAAARDDAVMRGNRDATTQCAALASAMQVLSAAAAPRDWKCMEDHHRFACGFDGEIVCHVRDRLVWDDELCGGTAAPAPGASEPGATAAAPSTASPLTR